MSSHMIDLGRRAVACDGWRWMPGMRLQNPSTDSTLYHTYRLDDSGWTDPRHGLVWLPDLTDPATLGCLEALVCEAWGCDQWRRLTVEPAGAGWCVIVRNGRHRPPSRAHPGWDLDGHAHPRYRNVMSPLGDNMFATKAEALVIALEAAPRRGGK